jgi:NADP-dependent 3-hydroxy acid dehydrogenase YdfG
MGSRLHGKVALVTGASSGIGAATARVLAREGAAVALLARRKDRLQALAEELAAEGAHCLAAPADVARRSEVDAAVSATERALGEVDILVNNAGVMMLSMLEERRVEDWDRMIDVNVKGVLYGIAAVLPSMLRRGGGHIVNVGSVAGRRPLPSGTVYSATKFAVRAISAGIHRELSAAHGVRVTDVEPGVVDTELTDHIPDPETRDAFRKRWSDLRMLTSDDIAQTVLFAVTAPDRMNVNEILVRPTDQAM